MNGVKSLQHSQFSIQHFNTVASAGGSYCAPLGKLQVGVQGFDECDVGGCVSDLVNYTIDNSLWDLNERT
jgi:hypothetical protein